MESSHKPSRVNICDGMCNACGAEGAIREYARAAARPFGREFRVVVSMNQVVRDAWVLRMDSVQRLKQSGRLFLPGVRLVGRGCVGQECERV